jgi:hypothetical protein
LSPVIISLLYPAHTAIVRFGTSLNHKQQVREDCATRGVAMAFIQPVSIHSNRPQVHTAIARAAPGIVQSHRIEVCR